jgi:ribosomal protein S3
MGQKIHPLGFRVGITKKHQSVWFARFHKHQYAQSVLEDRFLRQNLLKVLPQLFQKKLSNSPNMPKISHIQIVRGLIPYEIGIQIHAQNCHLIKAAFEDFDVQPTFVHDLLKNHFILEKASKKQKIQNEQNFKAQKAAVFENSEEIASSDEKFTKKSDVVERRKKVFKKFRERFLGKVVVLKNGKKITKKFEYTPQKQLSFQKNLGWFFQKNLQERRNSRRKFFPSFSKSSQFEKTQKMRENFSPKQKAFVGYFKKKNSTKAKFSKACTKFVNFYMSQTNISFLNALKTEMNAWNQYFQNSQTKQIQEFGTVRYAPFGSAKKWSFRRFQRFEKLSFALLLKLYKSLQQRAFKKMERLRKEYLIFGKLSKTKTLAYFQRIRFLQNFKKYISIRKTQKSNVYQFQNGGTAEKLANQKFALKVASLTEKAIQRKITNIHTEQNTIKFIHHLQDLVKHHRSKNIFLYLATISDARKQSRKIQRFTKQQSDFLFGISLKNFNDVNNEEKRKILKNQVVQTFSKMEKTNVLQKKSFHDVFVEQLQKQRHICEQNMQLIPKISLQFYSVKNQTFFTRASSVADSIVDDLEKRKAFRRVIKKAKEDLMKTPKVKGVKIQVSGRLNGAEIARSEWVRAGRVPLQTLRANIDYCYKTAQTIYGIIGVKVWIYKGYTKTRKPSAKAPAVLSDLL